jgi:hypothetical protein
MRLAGQYTNKDQNSVQIHVFESGGNLEVKEVGTTERKCAGTLKTKVNDGRGTAHIALGALILDTMFARPKGSGIGAILVYEYAVHASRVGKAFLGIVLVAGTTPEEPGPRAFYYKMGFTDSVDVAIMQQDAVFQSMPTIKQQTMLVSMPMVGSTLTVAESAKLSWSKQWKRS